MRWLLVLLACVSSAQTLTVNQTTYRALAGAARPIWWRLCASGSADNCTQPSDATVDLTVTSGDCSFAGSSTIAANEHAEFTLPASPGTCAITAQARAGGSPVTINATAYAGRPAHRVSPFYSVLYRGQTTVLQSLVYGYVDTAVASWTVTPNNGGLLVSGSGRSVSVTGITSGTYTVTATSTNGSMAASAKVVVTGHWIPRSATSAGTFPIDCTATGGGTTYEVTNPTEYAALAWNSLNAGDTVRVWYNGGTPYPYAVQLSRSGTAAQPIRVCGVRDAASGNLPIITGQSAQFAGTYPSGWQSFVKGLFLVTGGAFGTSTSDADSSVAASYVIIEGFELAWADTPYTVGSYSWAAGSAGIFLRGAYDVVIRGNYIHDNGFGIISSPVSGNGSARLIRRLTVEGNHIANNAASASGSMHNQYLQGEGIIVQGNWLDRNKTGSQGSTLKIRAAGSYVRYNQISGTLRDIDYVEIQDWSAYAVPSYFGAGIAGDSTWTIDDVVTMHQLYARGDYCYGNVLIDDDRTGNGQVPGFSIHYAHDIFPSADHNAEDTEHGGTLQFYFNSWYQYRSSTVAGFVAFDLTRSPAAAMPNQWGSVDLANNVIFLGGSTRAYIIDSTAGRVNLRKNWTSGTWTANYRYDCSALTDVKCFPSAYVDGNHHIIGLGNLVGGASIPFNATTYAPSAPLVGTADPLPSAVSDLAPLMSYYPATHSWALRTSAADMGAIGAATPPYYGPRGRISGMRVRGLTIK